MSSNVSLCRQRRKWENNIKRYLGEASCETEEMVSLRGSVYWNYILSVLNTKCVLLQRSVEARAGQDEHVALCPNPRNASTLALLRPRNRT